MVTCPAFRTLLTVADHALNFAAFLVHPIAGWNAAADELYLRAVRPHDGAERLAEAEAETEVGEPSYVGVGIAEDVDIPIIRTGKTNIVDVEPGSLAEQCLTSGPYAWTICSKPTGHDGWHGYAGISWSEDGRTEERLAGVMDVARAYNSGMTFETGPRPRLSTPGPRITDSDRLDTLIGLREDIYGQLENVAAQLEEVRNLLLEDGRGHGKDGGQRAEWSSGADFLSSPPSPSQSSSPATGRSLPPIPVYPAFNRLNPDSSCAVGEAQCCGPAAQESPAAGFEWLTPPAAGQPNETDRRPCHG